MRCCVWAASKSGEKKRCQSSSISCHFGIQDSELRIEVYVLGLRVSNFGSKVEG